MEQPTINYTFMRNPVRLQCFQMTKQRRASNADWPNWLHLAWQKDRDSEGALQPTIPGTGNGTLSLCGSDYEQEIKWGDWLVQEIDDTIRVYSQELFNDSFIEE